MFSKTECVGRRLCPDSLEELNVKGFAKLVVLVPYFFKDTNYYIGLSNGVFFQTNCERQKPFDCIEEYLNFKRIFGTITHITLLGKQQVDKALVFVDIRESLKDLEFVKLTPTSKLDYLWHILYTLSSSIERVFMEEQNLAVNILDQLSPQDLINFCKTNSKGCNNPTIKKRLDEYNKLLEQVKSEPLSLKDIPIDKHFKDLYLEAVKQDGYALQYVPEEKRTTRVCLIAVKQNGIVLQFVPKEKRTEEICLEAVKDHGRALQYVPEEKRTEEICLEAVKQNGYALKFVPKEKRTREIYLEAVKQNGLALQYVPKEKRTEEICLEAVKQNRYAFKFVPDHMKKSILEKLH
jgi:phage gp46-like protein